MRYFAKWWVRTKAWKGLRVRPMRYVNAENAIARSLLDVLTLLGQSCLHAVPCVQSKVCAKLTKSSEKIDVFCTKASKACQKLYEDLTCAAFQILASSGI